jgi:hypothetical protein
MPSLSGFNASSVQPATAYEALPAGTYTAIITESEMKSTKRGDGEYLQLTLQIIDGEHSGRKLWDRLKERNGWYHVDDIPGFLECCEEMFEGGYSASDIAVTFGVSREWIRQVLVSRFGVATQGALVRYWDDDLNQFRAYSLDDLAAMARTRAQTRGERQR